MGGYIVITSPIPNFEAAVVYTPSNGILCVCQAWGDAEMICEALNDGGYPHE